MIDFSELEARIDIAGVTQLLNLELTPSETGLQLRGQCPNCKGGDRSLVVTPSKGVFYCFTEQAGGGMLGLVAHLNGLPIKEKDDRKKSAKKAGEILAKLLNMPEGAKKTAAQTKVAEAAEPAAAESKKGFDRAKYQGTLDRANKLLEGLPPEFLDQADIGVPTKGSFKGEIVIATYSRHTGQFMEYISVSGIKRFKRRGNEK